VSPADLIDISEPAVCNLGPSLNVIEADNS
jgi:hypothetical protein